MIVEITDIKSQFEQHTLKELKLDGKNKCLDVQ